MKRSKSRRSKSPQLWLVGLLALVVVGMAAVALLRSPASSGATSAVPVPTPPSTARATPSPGVSLREAKAALRESGTVSVLGDSTSNDGNEWVALWAAHLGEQRRVTLHQWLDGRYVSERSYGSAGDELTIWNGSLPGGSANWAAGLLPRVQPERPGLVVLSFGHNNTSENVGEQLGQLRKLVEDRWGAVPVVLVLQNPGQAAHAPVQAQTLAAASGWARRAGVPTVDVTASFTDPSRLMYDDRHPNEEGSKVWAGVVERELG